MIHKMLERGELPLSDAVHPLLHVNTEVFVAPSRLQRDRKITNLEGEKKKKKKMKGKRDLKIEFQE